MTTADGSAVAAIVLAAGGSSRYRAADPDATTKLVAQFNGSPLVRHVAQVALASRARPVVVVTGYEEDRVRAALAGLPVVFAPNPDYATGLASSLKAGLRAVARTASGALILLGDMPLVAPSTLDGLIGAFEADSLRVAIAPTYGGRRGNPVLLSRRVFAQVGSLNGDEGARRLIAMQGADVREWPAEAGVALDIDTPEDLARAERGGSA